ncbi:MAG TPA: SEC-C domain-containing protein [Caldilinea sp.]|nr:SEC-C domain-containing protein [Caldilinea sp.]
MSKRNRRNKIGRNDPCWCGSGLKHKNCHLGRERQTPPTQDEVNTAFKKTWSKKYCLHPLASKTACTSSIIKAHTIQRNGGLSLIARDGHIYCFRPESHRLKGENKLLEPSLIGLRSASTFTGFCNRHDNATFAPIEREPFISTSEQTSLLGYRAICRELFLKKAQSDFMPFLLSLDRGKEMIEQAEFQHLVQTYGVGVSMGLNDLQHHKTIYDKMLLSGDYSEARYYVVGLQNVPEIMCSGSMPLEYDFDGRLLQALDKPAAAAQITFSLIATDTGGAAVFHWASNSNVCVEFIRSLNTLSDTSLPHAIVRFAFDSFENVFFSPHWWDSLDHKEKIAIQERAGYIVGPEQDINPYRLRDDGIRAVSWIVTSRKSNTLTEA